MKTRSLSGFRFLSLALVVFVLLNLGIFGVVSSYPSALTNLAVTPDNPAGILTANFTHYDAGHLTNNLVGFVILSTFFVAVNLSASPGSKRRSSKIFVLGSVLAGVVACAFQFGLWLLTGTSDIGAVGASGIVYGAAGILLASSIYNFFGQVRDFRALRQDYYGSASPKLFIATSFSITTTAFFTYLALFETNVFFLVSPNVAWIPHEIGFVSGFLVTLLLFFVLRSPKRGVDDWVQSCNR